MYTGIKAGRRGRVPPTSGSDEALVKGNNKNRSGMIALKKKCLEDMYENSRPMKRVELINLQMKVKLLKSICKTATPLNAKSHRDDSWYKGIAIFLFVKRVMPGWS